MANGHGGKRPGAGRKAQSKEVARIAEASVPAQPRRKSRALAMALDIIRQSHALAHVQQRDQKLNPFQLPAFPPAAVPKDKKLQMAMDNSLTWAGTQWAESTINGVADAGLLFPGYPFLSLLAQRQEYRLVSETIADDATRRWIDFEVTGNKQQKKNEEKERERQARAALGQPVPGMDKLPGGDPLAQQSDPGGGRTFQDPDPDERAKRIDRAGKADKVKAIKDEMLRLEARDRFYCVSRDDGFFGRSHLYMNFGTDIDGDAPDELRTPIGDGRDDTSRGKVNKGRPLQSLRVIEPVWTYPTTYNAVNPLREDWYNPQVWYVLGKEIHRSRLPTFISHPVPDLLKPAYSFGGISMSQLVKPYVDIWLTTRSSVGQLIHSFSVMVLMTDMQTILQPTGAEGDDEFPMPNVGGLLARVAEFNALRDNQNTFVLNKDTEDFKNVSASLAGLHELQAQSLEHIASCSRIPLVKLTGISPSGLNACLTGDTLIETDQGYIPIRDTRPGQKVMTREGWAPIAKVGCTGYATELIEIETAESTIRCTADHRIWLPSISAFVPAQSVCPGDLLLCRGATDGRNTANQSHIGADFGGTEETATTPLRSLTKGNICFTGRFGAFTRGLFRRAITFITSTRIARTINSTISSRSLLPIMPSCTASPMGFSFAGQLNSSANAAIAASGSSFRSPRGSNSALIGAGWPTDERIESRRPNRARSAFVLCAAYLLRRNGKTQNTAPENARPRAKTAPHTWPTITRQTERDGSNTASGGYRSAVSSVRRVPAREFVYDIQVAPGHLPEFFANGICVHNSSEGEIRAYYDTIAAYQNRFFRPNLTKLVNFVQLSLFGEIDPEITFEFEPLWEMSETERAELQQKEAETHKTYVDMGAIGNDEVRQVVIDDPKMPYADLDPEDVPELRAEEESGLIPEGGGRAVEPLLESGPGAGIGAVQENGGDPAFDQAPVAIPDVAYFDAMSEEQLIRLLAANDNELIEMLSSG